MKLAAAFVLALSAGAVQAATTVKSQSESCDQIRAQIKDHIGMPEKPNTVLLSKVGANKKCRFSSAEAYRAAWGDKPMPPDPTTKSRRKKHDADNH